MGRAYGCHYPKITEAERAVAERWLLDPEVAAADYEDGHLDPPPEWIRVINVAKWMGVEPWALAEQDDVWTEWGVFLMNTEHKAHERANRKANRKGGK